MPILRLAWRNAFRNRRRSVVTIGAMALALFFMVVYAGLSVGYLHHMLDNVLDLELGEIQVVSAEYADDPSLFAVMEDGQAVEGRIEHAGYVVAGRLEAVALVAADRSSAAGTIRGVDPVRDRSVSRLAEHVHEGTWLSEDASTEAVVGRRLARSLGVGVGDEIVVLGQAADGSMADQVLTVRGILGAITDDVDRTGVYVPEALFRNLFVVPQGYHRLIVRIPEAMPLDEAKARIAELAGGHVVRTWRELLPSFASMLDSTQAALYFMYAIVYVAIGIVLMNTMLMAVFERIREFGVMKALGVGPGGVVGLVLAETGMLTMVAAVVGIAASLPALWFLVVHGIDLSAIGGDLSFAGIAFDPVWRAEVTPDVFVGPLVSFFVICALSALYPAGKAAFITPVAAMRYR
ncbi:MAG: ABC transporter permease [Deltaproteobacteria bacterium]|nr:MAG: ABC transporter permease [Deltaproteobacteria bacterium]